MPSPLLKTKLFIPSLRDALVLRPRLLARLDTGQKHNLTLVSAPAGFGKTTIVSMWVRKLGKPVAWLTLDDEDNNLHRFLLYFITSLQTVYPTLGAPALASLQTSRAPDTETILTTVINQVVEQGIHSTLVLDDYHLIDVEAIHNAIIFLLDHQPSELRLVLVTRSDPPFPLSRFRGQNQLIELRTADLRFNPEETTAFLNAVMGLTLTSEQVDTLERRTEGWIVGLQMAAISLQGKQRTLGPEGTSTFIKTFTGGHRFVMDYLIEEVLATQPAEVQEYLLQTSVLDQLSAPLCDVLTGRTDGKEILRKIEAANLFLVPLDEERRWYRYHHLFADLLQRKLIQDNADQVANLHDRASRWFEANGYLEEAISHALASQDVYRAGDLVEKIGLEMIRTGELILLNQWLEVLPPELGQRKPWLAIFQAWASYYIGPRERVEEYLQVAETAMFGESDLPDEKALAGRNKPASVDNEIQHLQGHIAALRAYLALQQGDYKRVARLARQALAALPRGDYARATSAIALAETYRSSADLQGWYEAYKTARSIALEHENIPMAVSATTYMADQLGKQGRLPEAFDTYKEAIRIAGTSEGKPTPAAGLPYIKLGSLLCEWDDLPSARDRLLTGIQLCQEWGHSDSLVIGHAALARVALAEKDHKAAAFALQQARELIAITEIDPWVSGLMDGCQIQLWQAEGNQTAALHWVDTCGLKVDDEFNYLRDLEHIHLARALITRGPDGPGERQILDARNLLDRLLEKSKSVGWNAKSIAILILRSLSYQLDGQRNRALSDLAEALTLAEPGGYLRIFLDEGQPLAHLLYEAVKQGFKPDYCGKILARFHLESEEKPKPHSSLVEPLTPREIEVLGLIAAGLTNHAIGEKLSISMGTVKRHTANIYGKLGVNNRTLAAARGREFGILPP